MSPWSPLLAPIWSALICLAGYPLLIRALGAAGAGQRIRAEGPQAHLAKAGTPTAGGVLFILVPALVWALLDRRAAAVPALTGLLLGGILGLADDLANIRGARALGLPARSKFPLQLALAALTMVALARFTHPGLQLIPGLGLVELGWWWIPLGLLALVGASNAVNFTDGSDGLAGGVTLTVLLGLGLLALGTGSSALVLLLASLGLALAAFEVFNFHPARIFMGDTGSMALGFLLAAAALQLHVVLLLPLLGLVYVIETLSVVAQVAYFKRTGGKRLLRMSPFHHHLQLSGWKERPIVLALAAVNLVGVTGALALSRWTR